jgi:hypothetical protein
MSAEEAQIQEVVEDAVPEAEHALLDGDNELSIDWEEPVEDAEQTEDDAATTEESSGVDSDVDTADAEVVGDEADSEDAPGDPVSDAGDPVPRSVVPWSDDAVAFALKRGLSVAELNSLRQEGRLEGELRSRLFAPEASGPSTDEQGETETASVSDDEYKPNLDLDQYDENVIGEFDRLNRFHLEREKRLEEQLRDVTSFHEQIRQAQEASRFQSEVQTFDTIASGIDASLLGDKPLNEYSQDSPEIQNRAQLWEQYRIMENGYRASGTTVPDKQTLMQQAYRAAFGDKVVEQKQRELSNKLKQRSKQHTAPPTSRRATTADSGEDYPTLKETWKTVMDELGQGDGSF